MRKWLNKILYDTQDEYYKSISDLPLYNWIKCNSGKTEFTRIGKNGNKQKDNKNWVLLYDEYLEIFGLNKKYKKYLLIKQKKALLQSEFIINKDPFKKTEIEIQNAKLKTLEGYFGDGQKIEVVLMWLGKFLGYKLNTKETNVNEYFTILEEYGKANKTV
tara:strand:+ start:11932 stop:12411 length:480 start_codon:yes stop_codon:yes gene_type:complete